MLPKNKTALRAVATFFAFEIFLTTIFPTSVFALTAGPTAPESSSFEPVDTTDMVNVLTGDFVYNLPLLEVPGPSGGYPLSLSYHAGIQPDLDASWVGLGFTLNPGAINRMVDGTPDDHSGTSGTERTFWEGGKSLDIATSASYGNGLLTAGLTYSGDTYRGNSVGTYLSSNYVGTNSAIGINYSVDAFGKSAVKTSFQPTTYSTALNGIGGLVEEISGSSSISSVIKSKAKQRLRSMQGKNWGVGFDKSSSKDGMVRSKGWGGNVNVTLPNTGFSFSLGAKYRRYWIDEKKNTSFFGALYFPTSKAAYEGIQNYSFDITDLSSLKGVPGNLTEVAGISDNPAKDAAGTFVTYDNYVVTGQGISGAIKPFHLTAFTYRSTQKNSEGNTIVRPISLGGNHTPNFRFVDDFSNRFIYDEDDFDINTSLSTSDVISFGYDNDKIGVGDNEINGFTDGHLAGSRDVKSYSVSSMLAGEADILLPKALGYVMGASPMNEWAIGGIKVTNESGVTYHYSLPVYSYDEYSYSGYKDHKGKDFLNQYKRTARYAYTWLLTAVTGPDYIDRDGDRTANEGDYGYWISFEYGKWAGAYNWRNPAEGFSKDVDLKTNFFSKGKKELYYLNAIKSATHTALFVKSLRPDGKGVVHEIENSANIDISKKEVTKIDNGGFEPVTSGGVTKHSTSTLRLDEVLLLKNADLNWSISQLSSRSGIYNHAIGGNEYHAGNNVLDIHDVEDIMGDLRDASQRTISFSYDYSLTPGTPNSFISAVDQINSAHQTIPEFESGKLTLKAVSVGGKAGERILPPTQFSYDLGNTPTKGQWVATETFYNDPDASRRKDFVLSERGVQISEYSTIEPGDIVELEGETGSRYYVVALTASEQGNRSVRYISENGPASGEKITSFRVTKNPPYMKDALDIWGFLKTDYTSLYNGLISKLPSDLSTKGVDAWSLRTIKTPLGGALTVEYESDQYENSIKQTSSLAVYDIKKHPTKTNRVIVEFSAEISDELFHVNDDIKLHGIMRKRFVSPGANWIKCDCDGLNVHEFYQYRNRHDLYAKVTGLGRTFIEVESPHFYSDLTEDPRWARFKCDDLTEQHITSNEFREYWTEGPYEFAGGDIELASNRSRYRLGGGLRVAAIQSFDPVFLEGNRTEYSYSKGVTSYEPVGFDVNINRIKNDLTPCATQNEVDAITEYQRDFTFKVAYKNTMHLLANARLLPSPGVIYGTIKVQQFAIKDGRQMNPLPSYNEYEFEVFSPKLVAIYNRGLDVIDFDNGYKSYDPWAIIGSGQTFSKRIDDLDVQNIYTNTVALQDLSAVVGALRSVKQMDLEGRVLSETRNHYLFDELEEFSLNAYREKLKRYKDQGLIEEVFADAKFVRNSNDKYDIKGTISKISRFPSIPTGSTQINNKTGLKTVVENFAFDFYSGQVTQTLEQDGFGNSTLTATTPAYRVPQYESGMGLPINGGSNMLIQEARTDSYKVNVSELPDGSKQVHNKRLVSSTIQTWTDYIETLDPATYSSGNESTGTAWKMKSKYIFTGSGNSLVEEDGTFPVTEVSVFDWDEPEPTAGAPLPNFKWTKVNEVTLYDRNSHVLESYDINRIASAAKFNQTGDQVTIAASNATYNDICFSGFETSGEGGVQVYNTNPSDTYHSGSKAIRLVSGSVEFSPNTQRMTPGRIYQIRYWAKDEGSQEAIKPYVRFNNGTRQYLDNNYSDARKSGGWYLHTATFEIPAGLTHLSVGCEATNAVIDDFRFSPATAMVNCYIYDRWGQLTYILDNNHLFTKYEYDGGGRLEKTFKESFQYPLTQTVEYKYHTAGSNP